MLNGQRGVVVLIQIELVTINVLNVGREGIMPAIADLEEEVVIGVAIDHPVEAVDDTVEARVEVAARVATRTGEVLVDRVDTAPGAVEARARAGNEARAERGLPRVDLRPGRTRGTTTAAAPPTMATTTPIARVL